MQSEEMFHNPFKLKAIPQATEMVLSITCRRISSWFHIKEITEGNNYRITSVFSHQADLSL